MPGYPASITSRPRPSKESSNAAVSVSNSRWRPMNICPGWLNMQMTNSLPRRLPVFYTYGSFGQKVINPMCGFFLGSLAVHTHQIPSTRKKEIGSARGFAARTSNLPQSGRGSTLKLSLAEGCTLEGGGPEYLHMGLIRRA